MRQAPAKYVWNRFPLHDILASTERDRTGGASPALPLPDGVWREQDDEDAKGVVISYSNSWGNVHTILFILWTGREYML